MEFTTDFVIAVWSPVAPDTPSDFWYFPAPLAVRAPIVMEPLVAVPDATLAGDETEPAGPPASVVVPEPVAPPPSVVDDAAPSVSPGPVAALGPVPGAVPLSRPVGPTPPDSSDEPDCACASSLTGTVVPHAVVTRASA